MNLDLNESASMFKHCSLFERTDNKKNGKMRPDAKRKQNFECKGLSLFFFLSRRVWVRCFCHFQSVKACLSLHESQIETDIVFYSCAQPDFDRRFAVCVLDQWPRAAKPSISLQTVRPHEYMHSITSRSAVCSLGARHSVGYSIRLRFFRTMHRP